MTGWVRSFVANCAPQDDSLFRARKERLGFTPQKEEDNAEAQRAQNLAEGQKTISIVRRWNARLRRRPLHNLGRAAAEEGDAAAMVV